MVPLSHLSSFWRTLEMPLISCEIGLYLKWSKDSILVAGTAVNQNPEFKNFSEETSLISQLKMILKHMITLETLQQVKVMITQQDVY